MYTSATHAGLVHDLHHLAHQTMYISATHASLVHDLHHLVHQTMYISATRAGLVHDLHSWQKNSKGSKLGVCDSNVLIDHKLTEKLLLFGYYIVAGLGSILLLLSLFL